MKSVAVVGIVAIVLSAGLCGCGSDEFLVHLSRLKEETKRQHKAADVQVALSPFFSGKLSLTNQLPKEITSLPIFLDGSTNVDGGFTTSTNVMLFTIGGGFGHWGILVARPGHDNEISEWHRERLKPWDNGVYFFSEYRWVKSN